MENTHLHAVEKVYDKKISEIHATETGDSAIKGIGLASSRWRILGVKISGAARRGVLARL